MMQGMFHDFKEIYNDFKETPYDYKDMYNDCKNMPDYCQEISDKCKKVSHNCKEEPHDCKQLPLFVMILNKTFMTVKSNTIALIIRSKLTTYSIYSGKLDSVNISYLLH